MNQFCFYFSADRVVSTIIDFCFIPSPTTPFPPFLPQPTISIQPYSQFYIIVHWKKKEIWEFGLHQFDTIKVFPTGYRIVTS